MFILVENIELEPLTSPFLMFGYLFCTIRVRSIWPNWQILSLMYFPIVLVIRLPYDPSMVSWDSYSLLVFVWRWILLRKRKINKRENILWWFNQTKEENFRESGKKIKCPFRGFRIVTKRMRKINLKFWIWEI